MAKIPANILKMALDPLADSAQAIVRNVSDITADKVGALTRMADDVVDDWGWKGGKPGEITGGAYLKKEDEAFAKSMKVYKSQPDAAEELYDKAMSSVNSKVQKQLLSGGIFTENYYPSFRPIMKEFNTLEEADIPREWTGKVLKALKNSSVRMHNTVLYDRGNTGNAVDISNIMRNMTNPERELFVTIIPKANSVKKAADIFQAIKPLTESQRDTFLSLLPEWYGSLDELAVAARSLT